VRWLDVGMPTAVFVDRCGCTIVTEPVRPAGVELDVAEHPVGLGTDEVVDVDEDGRCAILPRVTPGPR
jgi:hypothetical protein